MASIHELILNGRLSQLNLLLNKIDINVNEKDSYGRTPLHIAVLSNQENYGYRVVHLLLQFHANINAKDFQEQTPLIYACLLNRSKIITIFLQIKSLDWYQIDNQGYTILHHAAASTNLSIFKNIIHKIKLINFSMDSKTDLGYTPLILAIKSLRFDNAIYLLDHTDVSPLTSDNEYYLTCRQWIEKVSPKSNEFSMYSNDYHRKLLEENSYTPDILSPRHKDRKLSNEIEKSNELWIELVQRLDNRILLIENHQSNREEKVSPWYNDKLNSKNQIISLINNYSSVLTINHNETYLSKYNDRPKSILRSKESMNKYRFRKEVKFSLN